MSKRTRKLRRLNRQLDEKLTPASTAMLRQITRRICTAPISAYQQESIRHDVIEILQEAESRGTSPEEAIGGDIAAFCDSVLAEAPSLTARERRLYALRDILFVLQDVLFFELCFCIGLSRGIQNWPMLPITSGIALSSALLLLSKGSFVLLARILTHTSFIQVYYNNLAVRMIQIPWSLLCLALGIFVKGEVLISVSAPIMIAVTAAIIALYVLLDEKTA